MNNSNGFLFERGEKRVSPLVIMLEVNMLFFFFLTWRCCQGIYNIVSFSACLLQAIIISLISSNVMMTDFIYEHTTFLSVK